MGGFTSANALSAVLLVAAVGCGGPPRCASSGDCASGQVCGLAARCGPLRAPPGARFAGSRWLMARDWGVTGPGPLTDRLRVGGGRESLLAFGPVPESSRLLRALLVLHPHESATRLSREQRLVVEPIRRFVGGALPRRGSTQPDSFAAAIRPLAAGPPRPVRLDVTEAARDAADAPRQALYLLIRAEDVALSFASPHHHARRARPRLELLVH